ncbi:hypothetical protein SAMN05428642_1021138 [Flaviramulus basaltis]|uniref:Dockerin domain-containing protein n=1 Tax=Flaviramulus basaltis TaxID=369401 RepID=A0A1K2IKS3_9FLAO|nr:hypothetical protein [Flaviramulus basaltis]SFZ93028.1 hypothetical protein SAMN05428642_1021138 [Flaviramulus basaltis]
MARKNTFILTNIVFLFFVIFGVNAQITTYPYAEDFENGDGGWTVQGFNPTWELGMPSIGAGSGDNAWATNLDGNYGITYNEQSWVQSPIFDFSNLINPSLVFQLYCNIEFDQIAFEPFDGVVIQYSIDSGITWQNVGSYSDENWFNDEYIEALGSAGWGFTSGWVSFNKNIKELGGQNNAVFRFFFGSDFIYNNAFGASFDLFEVYEDTTSITLITDLNFEQYLLDTNIDTDGIINGQVLTYDIIDETTLNINSYDISNFEGIQDFRSLINFTLINNQSTTNYSIEFSENKFLQDVTIINTPFLSSINGLSSNYLTNLSVVTRGDFFTSLDVSECLSLTDLSLADNAITNVNLEKNTKIRYLSLAINPIDFLYTTHLTELESLNTYESQIKFLDLSNNSKLTRLNSDNGELTEVNLKNGFNNMLTSVELNGNPNLTCIQVDDVAYSNTASSWLKDNTASYSNSCEFKIQQFPYAEDFEEGAAGWSVVNVSNSSWGLDSPNSNNLTSAASGSLAWSTNNSGDYNPNENGWVQSPIFDFSKFNSSDNLYFHFDNWYNCELDIDGAVVQSTIDSGISWQNLDEITSVNTYDNTNIASLPGGQEKGWSGISENTFSGGWKTSYFSLSNLLGVPNVMFRVVFSSNGTIQSDGFAFDSVKILTEKTFAGNDNIDTFCEKSQNVSASYLQSLLISETFGGIWSSLDGLELDNDDSGEKYFNIGDLQSGNYKFKYTVFSEFNSSFDEATVELNIERIVLYSQYYDYASGCSELTFNTDEEFQQWAFNKHVVENNGLNITQNGVWSPSSFEGYGDYTYTQPATSSCSETISVFRYGNSEPEIAYKTFEAANGIQNVWVLIDDFESDNSLNKIVSKKRRRRIRSSNKDIDNNGNVDFPNTGAGNFKEANIFEVLEEDDCGSIIKITNYAIIIGGFWDGGENNIISICEGEVALFSQLQNALGDSNVAPIGDFGLINSGAPGFFTEYPPGSYTYYYSMFGEEDANSWTDSGGTITVTNKPVLKLSLLLEGAYNEFTGWMNNVLYKNDLIQTSSPYSDGLETYYYGSNQVDWVWLEIRDANNDTNIPLQRSALLKRNGDVVDVDGESPILLDVPDGDYYIMVSHRNHLGVIMANPVSLSCGTTITIDLRLDNSLVLGGANAIKETGYGDFVLFAGDFNGDGQIQNIDKNAVEPLRGLSGYSNADMDMNGEVQNSDINNFLSPNIGKGVQFMSKKLNAKRNK